MSVMTSRFVSFREGWAYSSRSEDVAPRRRSVIVIGLMLAMVCAQSAIANPDATLYQHWTGSDFVINTDGPFERHAKGFNDVSHQWLGNVWTEDTSGTHLVWVGTAVNPANQETDAFITRIYSDCLAFAGSECDEVDISLANTGNPNTLPNVQPLYKCYKVPEADTYVSRFEDCANDAPSPYSTADNCPNRQPGDPGFGWGCPTGEGPYFNGPDHLLGFMACRSGPDWATPRYGSGDPDNDGLFGDCDDDDDNDGTPDSADNCVLVANDQSDDIDGDGVGDACDGDIDGDLIENAVDNCPFIANNFPHPRITQYNSQFPDNQNDLDLDQIGDACDLDVDNDGWANDVDNCRWIPNPSQTDLDQDGLGEACDCDEQAFCSDHSIALNGMQTGDMPAYSWSQCSTCGAPPTDVYVPQGVGPSMDQGECTLHVDSDDGVNFEVSMTFAPFLDSGFACCEVDAVSALNGTSLETWAPRFRWGEFATQPVSADYDINENDIPDGCEDWDGDAVTNALDNCPTIPNSSQADSDDDRIGDHCDLECNAGLETTCVVPEPSFFSSTLFGILGIAMQLHIRQLRTK